MAQSSIDIFLRFRFIFVAHWHQDAVSRLVLYLHEKFKLTEGGHDGGKYVRSKRTGMWVLSTMLELSMM